MSVFEDRKWTIAVAVSLAGVLLPVALSATQRGSKQFQFKIISEAVVLDLSDPALSEVEAYSKGKQLTKLSVLTFELANTGTIPIQRADFDTPITVHLPDKVAVLRASVVESKPREFSPVLVTLKDGLRLEPALWNPGDSVVLQLFAIGSYSTPRLSARIAGVREIESAETPTGRDKRRAYITLTLGVLGQVGYGFFMGVAWWAIIGKRPVRPFPIWLVVIIGLLISFGSVVLLKWAEVFLATSLLEFGWRSLGVFVVTSMTGLGLSYAIGGPSSKEHERAKDS